MTWDAVILGGGAAGLMCAAVAAQRGKQVMLLERQERVGKKILISGGGRCNFTNIGAKAENYLSERPDFCRSALARYQPRQFVELVERHGIAYHEKKLGQLFCDNSSREIVALLVAEATEAGAKIKTSCQVNELVATTEGEARFLLRTNQGDMLAKSVVVATGGLSFPKLGASDFGHRVAQKFGLTVTKLRPGLVPLTWGDGDGWAELSGISVPVRLAVGARSFTENLLFTHRGISGPAVLQISSYWKEGMPIEADLLPDFTESDWSNVRQNLSLEQILGKALPGRFLEKWGQSFPDDALGKSFHRPWAQVSLEHRQAWRDRVHHWELTLRGTEGYAKAEVTVGGVDTGELSSKTMEARQVPGLYFIGEVVDVTGWLGGYNFQWAWASGNAVGQAL